MQINKPVFVSAAWHAAGALVAGLLLVAAANFLVDMPTVTFNYATGECVGVYTPNPDPKRDQGWACGNLPPKYFHEWSK